MFSQRNEEKYILQFFKNLQGLPQGRFLDIGAYDGKTFSNTHQLALQGWGGVCVEASPSLYQSLHNLYDSNPKIQIVEIGIGMKRGILPFYDFYGDAIGTFDKKHALLWEKKGSCEYEVIPVSVITVKDLLEQVGYDFDFLNLDIEGWSFQVLKLFPFNKFPKLKMICVEFDGKENEVVTFLKTYGYTHLYTSAENVIMVKL